MKVVSFLASHGGSAARAIIAAAQKGDLDIRIGTIITNNKDSAIYQWCVEEGVPVQHISGNTHPDEETKDAAIKATLQDVGTDLVVLSGYMKKIGPQTLSAFSNSMLNIHPSLLPKHGGHGLYGDNVHRSVLESGDDTSGATVHLVNEAYDEGPIVAQKVVPVMTDDTLSTLKARVQSIESELYIEAIRTVI